VTRPRWLSLDGKAMAEIRELPAIQMLTEWLEWERAAALELVHEATVMKEDPALRSGTVIAIDHILKSLHTPLAIADLPEEKFKDPARRPSRKDEDAEV